MKINLFLSLQTLVLVYFFSVQTWAAVLSPSSKEVEVQFRAEFITQDWSSASEDLIKNHYQHFFGYFHSRRIVKDFGYRTDVTEGIGVPAIPLNVYVTFDQASDEYDGYRLVKYKAQGKMLFLNQVADKLLASKKWDVTLPYDLDAFYKESCTDDYYTGFGDFWYYYDPFRKGCDFLRQEPMAKNVKLEFKKAVEKKINPYVNLNEIHGDNGNGQIFDIVTINGFATDYKGQNDEGRWAFEEMNNYFRNLNFSEKILAKYENRPIVRFEKTVKSTKGVEIQVRVTRLLVETSITKKNITFAKFFKNAIENADVLIYAGHSGLGGNLDLPALENKVGSYNFNSSKKQIFFFDGCASYSYYLNSFLERSENVKILSNGLSSFFQTESLVHQEFFKHILNFSSGAKLTWMQLMLDMDSVLGARTYMLNVGGL
jgi:hypothetical protein